MIRDGETLGNGSGTYHWEFARSCLDALQPRGAETNADERQWYRAVAATLHQFGDYPELEVHFARALELFPDDPILELFAGAMHEAYAGPHVQRSLDGQQRRPSPAANSKTGPPGALPRSESKERDLAHASFRRALEADPSLAEARIRLGEVLDAQGKHDDAVTELQRALGAPLAPKLEYWGRLLLGRAEHARDRLDAAARAFERARVLFPKAQSPVFSLSQVARDGGDRAGALRLLAELPDLRWLAADDDPWWTYYWTHEPDSATLVRQLWGSMVR